MEKSVLMKGKADCKDSYDAHIIEQYKLYVEMADRVSQRRMNANTFFISVTTLLFTITSFIGDRTTFGNLVFGILGCILCFAWYFTLKSYRQLNSGKFEVIHEMEKLLPLSCYAYEWDILDKGENPSKYWPISHIEKIVPAIFFVAYLIHIIYHLILSC